jgi:hypothetical protein
MHPACAGDLDEPLGSEEFDGTGPDDIGPAATVWAFL